jgi:hypothetical protein
LIDCRDISDIPEHILEKIRNMTPEERLASIKLDITTFQPVLCIDEYKIPYLPVKEGE